MNAREDQLGAPAAGAAVPDAPPILDVRGLRMHFPLHGGGFWRRQVGVVK